MRTTRVHQGRVCLKRLAIVIGLAMAVVSPGTADKPASRTENSKSAVQKPSAPTGLEIVSSGRDVGRVRLLAERDRTVIDVVSPFGIGKSEIRLAGERWPRMLVVRLHLTGLESFRGDNGEATVVWSVSSVGGPETRVALWHGQETSLSSDSPYFTRVRLIGRDDPPRIPLRDGYFEVPIPAKLLSNNPPQLRLHWIDFFRG